MILWFVFNIGQCRDASELLCFILDMMVEMMKLYDFDLDDLGLHTRSQDHKNLCSHSVLNLQEAPQMSVMVDGVRKKTSNKSC